ncbi:MAG: DUF1330 domain-containing protein [Alphaproteobacteria bacterium]|nr:DUF1330 domain-containing protein [Alphaproteobacteria bacterium]
MATYMIVDVNIHDVDAYEIYKSQVTPIIEKFGGEYLVRGGAHEVLENDLWSPTRMVMVRFPDKKSALDFIHSDEYAPVKKMRRDNSDGTVLIVEGL